jgi:peptidoglycan/xylan/chitin deacetylase (PgdA/CDA1 family)
MAMKLALSSPFKSRIKRQVTQALGFTGATTLFWRWQRLYYGSDYIRAVLYHQTLPANRSLLESHFRFFSEQYMPIGLDELGQFLDGKWKPRRPGIIICFDDGLRSNYEVAAPLLKKYGLTGWFMIPAGLIEPDSEETRAKHARFSADHPSYDGDPRVFMSWNEIRELQNTHVIGCHTMSHFRLNDSHDDARLEREIADAKQLLESRLGREVAVFAWVGGEPHNRGRRVARKIREAGFRYAFLTHMSPITPDTDAFLLQRTGLDDSYTLATVKYYLSGLSDLLTTREREATYRNLVGGLMK